MSYYAHAFDAPIETYDVGSDRYLYTVVWLPDAVVADLPLKQHPKLRIVGEANEIEFKSALMPVRGRWYILFSATALKAMGVGVGDEVSVSFNIDDQDAVEVPDVLAKALRDDDALAELWGKQTPGRQRGFAYRVASAKSAATQARRIVEIGEMMRGERDKYGKRILPS